jgi:beta-galactosidase/beta-glucuronidase
MWYTPVSGIWQSVWLEWVPTYYIEKIKMTPDLEGVDIEVQTQGGEADGFRVCVTLHNGQTVEKTFSGSTGRVQLTDVLMQDGNTYIPKLWTLEEPYLYSVTVYSGKDCVDSYFALRTITIEETQKGKRVCLNGTPVFLHGVLDQGYFPEGIFLRLKPPNCSFWDRATPG